MKDFEGLLLSVDGRLMSEAERDYILSFLTGPTTSTPKVALAIKMIIETIREYTTADAAPSYSYAAELPMQGGNGSPGYQRDRGRRGRDAP